MSTTNLLNEKIAIVTGGTTGIGRAIALEYIKNGARVCVNHLGQLSPSDPDHISSMKQEIPDSSRENFMDIIGDITKPETAEILVKQTVERWGRLDIFVANAGVCRFADFLDVTPTLLSHTINTNLTGTFHTVQAAARQMTSQSPSGGSIIGVSSISALVGGGRQTHYTPTKAGILSLMQSCAVALGKHNIRCNALLPGTIRTSMNEDDLSDEAKKTYMEGRVPLGRLGEPKDMAGPAVFLASDLSAYVVRNSSTAHDSVQTSPPDGTDADASQ